MGGGPHTSASIRRTQNNENNFLIGSKVNRLHVKHIAKLLPDHRTHTHTFTNTKILLGIEVIIVILVCERWVPAHSYSQPIVLPYHIHNQTYRTRIAPLQIKYNRKTLALTTTGM